MLKLLLFLLVTAPMHKIHSYGRDGESWQWATPSKTCAVMNQTAQGWVVYQWDDTHPNVSVKKVFATQAEAIAWADQQCVNTDTSWTEA